MYATKTTWKDLASGYARNYNIPSCIVDICIRFTYPREYLACEFANSYKYVGDNFWKDAILFKSQSRHYIYDDDDLYAYGSFIVDFNTSPHRVITWNIQLEDPYSNEYDADDASETSCSGSSGSRSMDWLCCEQTIAIHIGIEALDCEPALQYFYSSIGGLHVQTDRAREGYRRRCASYSNGDEIEMRLNTSTKTIRYRVNHNDIGIEFKNIDLKKRYKLFIWSSGSAQHSLVSLKDFTITARPTPVEIDEIQHTNIEFGEFNALDLTIMAIKQWNPQCDPLKLADITQMYKEHSVHIDDIIATTPNMEDSRDFHTLLCGYFTKPETQEIKQNLMWLIHHRKVQRYYIDISSTITYLLRQYELFAREEQIRHMFNLWNVSRFIECDKNEFVSQLHRCGVNSRQGEIVWHNLKRYIQDPQINRAGIPYEICSNECDQPLI